VKQIAEKMLAEEKYN